MMLGMTQSRTSIMPRSLTTPGGVRFLDPANYVTQEELDRRDRRWRAMRERAWARAAAQACLSGVGMTSSSAARASQSSSSNSAWGDDAATLVGSVRYYAAATSSIRSFLGNTPSRRQRQQQQQQQQWQRPQQVSRTHTSASAGSIEASGTRSMDAASLPLSDSLVDGTTLHRRATHSSVESTSNASNLLDDADPFSDRAGNVFRRHLAGMTARSTTAPRSSSHVLRSTHTPNGGAATTSLYGNNSTRHLRCGNHAHAPSYGQYEPASSIHQSTPSTASRSRGAARLSVIRNQMRRRKVSEALQRLLGGVRV